MEALASALPTRGLDSADSARVDFRSSGGRGVLSTLWMLWVNGSEHVSAEVQSLPAEIPGPRFSGSGEAPIGEPV
jgi:hypothetical protein